MRISKDGKSVDRHWVCVTAAPLAAAAPAGIAPSMSRSASPVAAMQPKQPEPDNSDPDNSEHQAYKLPLIERGKREHGYSN